MVNMTLAFKVLICLISQRGCIRIQQYVAEMSDLNNHVGGQPCVTRTVHRVVPKSCKLSSLIEAYILAMKLFSACSLALWSVMRWRAVECGLVTTLIGILYMPGSRSGLKLGEN